MQLQTSHTPINPESIVHTLAIYEWERDISILETRGLLDRIAAIVGSPPDHVEVWAEHWKGKGYVYSNFIKRNIIHREAWRAINYLWKRQPDALLYFAVECHVSLHPRKCIAVHIDEAAVIDVDLAYGAIIDLLADLMWPVYGIGFRLPYSWPCRQFVWGQGSGATTSDGDYPYESREAFDQRAIAFGHVWGTKPNLLARKLRDLFEINLLSAGHLAAPIGGGTLEQWIGHPNRGSLRQIGPSTWRWDVPQQAILPLRQAMLAANLLAVGATHRLDLA